MLLHSSVPRTWTTLAAGLLVGCLSVRAPRAGEPLHLAPGEGLVLGRVRVLENDVELHPWRVELADLLAEDPEIRLALFRIEADERKPHVPLDGEGRFAWILPTGTYLIYHTPSIDPPCNEPLAAFQLSAGSVVLDVGELVLHVLVDHPIGSGQASYEVVGVDARPPAPETAHWFLATRPEPVEIQPGVLLVDPRLGRLFDDWSVEACARVLEPRGVQLLR